MKGLHKYFSITACVFGMLNGPSQNIDSLKLAFKTASQDTMRCKILIQLIETESDELVWPTYNEQLLKLSEKCAVSAQTAILRNFFLNCFADALNDKGLLSKQHGDIPGALEFYNKSLKIR